MRLSIAGIKSFVTRALTENLGLKAVAFLITLGLVIIVHVQEKVERWVDVEVNVIQPVASSRLVLTSEVPDTVRVSLRGRPSTLEDIKNQPLQQVMMDLSGRTKPGGFTFYFEPEMFDFPSGVQVIGISPDTVLTKLERMVSRTLPVRAKYSGRMKAGTQLAGTPVVDPSEVTVTGPASVVRGLISLETDEFDVEGFGVGEHHVNVPLRRAEGLVYEHGEDLKVTLQVEWTPGERSLEDLPVIVTGAGEAGVEVRPAMTTVSFAGPKVLLDGMKASSLSITADVAQGTPDKTGVMLTPVRVSGYPEEVRVTGLSPDKVMVKLSEPAQPKKKEN